MFNLRAAQLAELLGGQLHGGDPQLLVGSDVVIDSRQVTPGALFVALSGERVDGHDYVAAAASAGASVALVSRLVESDLPQILVADTTAGLTALAQELVRQGRRSLLQTVGITGSAGKTSTKDLLGQILTVAGDTVAAFGSFNNEIGVPLTACRINADTRFLVVEMGSRGLGHIAQLIQTVPLDVAVVLNIGCAHLGEFGTRDDIASSKGEIVADLAPTGWAVLNSDDDYFQSLAERTQAQIAAFSATACPKYGKLKIWASEIKPDAQQRFGFVVNVEMNSQLTHGEVALQVIGEHQVSNALAAIATALVLGLELPLVIKALCNAVPLSKWRMEIHERSDGLLVINDAYNANPDSMRAALDTLVALRRPNRRCVAILGDMLELGQASADFHSQIGSYAAAVGVDAVIAIGEQSAHLVAASRSQGIAATLVETKPDLIKLAADLLAPQDVVLVKASRGLALEEIATHLLGGG